MNYTQAIVIMNIERRIFDHGLLYALTEAGALTRQQAAAVCVDMTERLPVVTQDQVQKNPMLMPLVQSLVRKWEDVGAAMLGMDSLPKGN